MARQDAPLRLLQKRLLVFDRERVHLRGYCGIVAGEDHLQLHEAARAFRLEGLSGELVDVAPGAPVLAHHHRGVDQTADDLGYAVPFLLGDHRTFLVVEGVHLFHTVAGTGAQLEFGVGRQVGVPMDRVDDLGTIVAAYLSQVDKIRFQCHLSRITRREQHEFHRAGVPALIGDTAPEQVAHLAQFEQVAELEEAVLIGSIVHHQLGIVESFGHGKSRVDAALPGRIEEDMSGTGVELTPIVARDPLVAGHIVEKQIIYPEDGAQVHTPPLATLLPAALAALCGVTGGDHAIGVHVTVEQVFRIDGHLAVDEGTPIRGADAHVVAHGQHLHLGQGGVLARSLDDDADELDDAVAALVDPVHVHSGVQDHGAIGAGVFQWNDDRGFVVGLRGTVHRPVFEDILGSLDARSGGSVDRELSERTRSLPVRKGQPNLARQHRTTQVDVDKPLLRQDAEVRFPDGLRISVDDIAGRAGIAAGGPDPPAHLAARLRDVTEKGSIIHGIDLLAKCHQPQRSLLPDLHQTIGHLPALPLLRTVESQAFGQDDARPQQKSHNAPQTCGI